MAKALKIRLELSLHPHNIFTQIILGLENKYVCSISASCMSHLCHGRILPSNLVCFCFMQWQCVI